MKHTRFIILILLSLSLMTVTAHAFPPPAPGDGPLLDTKRIDTLQQQLHLTDEQTAAVKKIFETATKQRQEIMQKHHLKPEDLQKLQQKMREVKRDDTTPLHMILTGRQMMTLREDILGDNPASFQKKPRKAKLAQLQKELHIDLKKAEQVAKTMNQKYKQRQQILQSCNLSVEQMQAFQKDMTTNREKTKTALSTILSPEQMKQFEDLQQQRPSQGLPPSGRRGPGPQRP